MAHIAVVGAGLAGLTATQVLAAAGHQVTVFDKSRGSGGRMATKKVGSSSWDMGAQYARAHSADFSRQLAEWAQQGVMQLWQPQIASASDNGVQASADDVRRYVGMPRMTGLSRHLLASASHFEASTRIIDSRQQDDGQWLLEAEDGRHFDGFDALIINTPPQQAIPLLAHSPQLQQRCSSVTMSPCWTLLLATDDLPQLPDAAFVEHGPLAWVARNNSKPGREHGDCWVLQASHRWSDEHQDAPREEVMHQLLEAFGTIFKLSEVKILNHWLHRWLYAIPNNPLQETCLSDQQRKLAVCGDWCGGRSLEAAWISGRAAATELLQQLN